MQRAADGLGPFARAGIIGLGTIAGEMLIPQQPQAADAMRNPAVVLAFAMLLIPAVDAGMLGVRSALKIRNILLLGLVYWLLVDLIQGLYPIEASTAAIETAFEAVGLFAAGISIGGGLLLGGLPTRLKQMVRADLNDRQILILASFCFIIGIFYYVYMASFSLPLILGGLFDRGRFEAPWARGALGDWHSFLEQLIYFGYLLPPLTAVIFIQNRRWFNVKTIYCLVLSGCFLVFPVQTGARTTIGAVLGSSILAGVLISRRSLRSIHIVAAVAVVFVVQVAMNIILENRNSGLGNIEVQDWTFSRIRVDDNFNRLAQTADFVPTSYPYSGLQFVYVSLVRPIPRALWPGKPVYQGFTVEEAVGGGASLTSSVVGEAYAGWGFPLVFAMGMFFGVAARWWEQTLEDRPTSGGVLVYAFGTMALFCALRGFVNIILISYPILSLWGAAALFRFVRQRRTPRRGSV